jgi:hypothetical protein
MPGTVTGEPVAQQPLAQQLPEPAFGPPFHTSPMYGPGFPVETQPPATASSANTPAVRFIIAPCLLEDAKVTQ